MGKIIRMKGKDSYRSRSHEENSRYEVKYTSKRKSRTSHNSRSSSPPSGLLNVGERKRQETKKSRSAYQSRSSSPPSTLRRALWGEECVTDKGKDTPHSYLFLDMGKTSSESVQRDNTHDKRSSMKMQHIQDDRDIDEAMKIIRMKGKHSYRSHSHEENSRYEVKYTSKRKSRTSHNSRSSSPP